MAGLRSILEDVESPDLNNDTQQACLTSQGQECLLPAHVETRNPPSSNPNKMLFGSFNTTQHLDTTSEMNDFLLNVYHERVHALFKVLHWPSTLALLNTSSDLYDNNVQAFKSAIYFTSVCSLFDHELEGRRIILSQYRHCAEKAFIEAGLLTTTSFMVLQAFVIYLVSTDPAYLCCQPNLMSIRQACARARQTRSNGHWSPWQLD